MSKKREKKSDLRQKSKNVKIAPVFILAWSKQYSWYAFEPWKLFLKYLAGLEFLKFSIFFVSILMQFDTFGESFWDNNRFQDVPNLLLMTLIKLKSISMSFNSIERLKTSSFANLPEIENITLDHMPRLKGKYHFYLNLILIRI